MLKTNLNYRVTTINDLEQVMALGLLAYGQHRGALSEAHWQKMAVNFTQDHVFTSLLESSFGFVCETGHQIIGMAFLVPSGNPTPIFQNDWSYIRMVAVNPTYGGQGIARQLTNMCIEMARQTNESIVALHTSEFMDTARHLYESMGFKKLREIEPIFGKRYWVYTIEL